MSKFKGTQGEWHTVDKWSEGTIEVASSTGQIVAQIGSLEDRSRKEYMADARLIAAAPVMLKALERMLELKEYKDKIGKDSNYEKAKEGVWEQAELAVSDALRFNR